jgi:acyl carrier protein
VSAIVKKQIESVLLGVVAEKTGYPVGMLNLDMTLESDLGVDSIKRVEILSTIQGKLPDAPVVKPEHLGTLHSIRDVATFLSSNHSGLQPKTEPIDEIRMAKMPESVLIPMPGELKVPGTRSGQVQFEPILSDKLQQQPARQDTSSGSAPRSSTQLGLDIIDRSILQTVDLELKSPRTTIPFPEGSEIWSAR